MNAAREYNQTNAGPPDACFASKFQVAWIKAAVTMSPRAVKVIVPPKTKRYFNLSASGFLSLGCRPAACRLSVTLGPGAAVNYRNPSHHSVDRISLARQRFGCKEGVKGGGQVDKSTSERKKWISRMLEIWQWVRLA